MSRAEFVAATRQYVEKSLTSISGQKPSKATINKVAAKIVKEFAPVVVKKKS